VADDTKDAPAPRLPTGRSASPVSLEPSAWECCVPMDATVPRRTVTALTGGDAERAYREHLGVVTFGHPVSVTPADARERTDAE
jgi:hypothetical protein